MLRPMKKGFVVDYDNQIMFTILVLSVKGNRVQVSLRYPHYVFPETRLVSCSIEAREKAKANLKLVAI